MDRFFLSSGQMHPISGHSDWLLLDPYKWYTFEKKNHQLLEMSIPNPEETMHMSTEGKMVNCDSKRKNRLQHCLVAWLLSSSRVHIRKNKK